MAFPSQVLLLCESSINQLSYMQKAYLYPTIYGAYTELFAGLSPILTPPHAGSYILPWGRFSSNLKTELVDGMKTKDDGGTGVAKRFWDWCEEEVKAYA